MTTEQPQPTKPHRVVIVGAGFGGLEATFGLAGAPVSITLVDRRNHHLFQPLLYQVATASLATSEIAWPIRYLLRGRPEVTTLFATVSGVDAEARRVLLDDGDALPYDTLVLATGARHAYFGHDEWEPFAPGLKTLEDATTLRRRILVAFERAERETDPELRAALLTFVIVGAGPTGVELAGTIAELAQDTLPPDFRNIDTHKARVVLIEAGPRVLAGFPDDLSAYAQRSLESIGVEVVLGKAVTESHCTRPSRYFCHRRYRCDRGPRWKAGARHRASSKTAGALCRRDDQSAPARQKARAVSLQACRQPGADRQAQGGDRFRIAQTAGHHRMVDMGHRPHLFSDRPAQPASSRDQLAVDPRPRSARRAPDHAGLKQGGAVVLDMIFLIPPPCGRDGSEPLGRAARLEPCGRSFECRHFTSAHPPSAIGRNA
jgi:hypothetical protein